MDMNTIESVVATSDPGQWREGDAWLAGGMKVGVDEGYAKLEEVLANGAV